MDASFIPLCAWAIEHCFQMWVTMIYSKKKYSTSLKVTYHCRQHTQIHEGTYTFVYVYTLTQTV